MTALCIIGAALLCWRGTDISGGVLPGWLSRFIGHNGRFVCPFCGGTRAFVYVCHFDFSSALHASILGTLAAIWAVLTFPIRLWFALRHDSPCACFLYSRLKANENGDYFIIASAALMLLQMHLHYQWGFHWLPLEIMLSNS